MALTKVIGEGVQGISNASDATFLTATSSEGVTLAGTLVVTGVHTVGTNAVATSDGGAATTSIIQGLCKWWIKYSQDAGSGSQNLDSFNVSSVSDVETGRFDPTYSNNMNNANYCVSVMHQAELTNNDSTEYTVSQATNTTQLRTVENGALRDKGNANASAVGDLA